MLTKKEVLIPPHVIGGINDLRRLQAIIQQDPILSYVPSIDIPEKFTIGSVTRALATKGYESVTGVWYFYSPDCQTETYLGQPVASLPDDDWELLFAATYWHDSIFGLPPESDKLAVQFDSKDIQTLFFYNRAKNASLSGDSDDIAKLSLCGKAVKAILTKARQPIVKILEENGLPILLAGDKNYL